MENMNKAVTARSAALARAMAFVNGRLDVPLTGLEPRLVRYGSDGLLASIIEAMCDDAARVQDGALVWIRSTYRDAYGFNASNLAHIDSALWAPSGDVADLHANMVKVLEFAAAIWELVVPMRVLYSDYHGGTPRFSHCAHVLIQPQYLYNLVTSPGGVVEGPWYTLRHSQGAPKGACALFLKKVLAVMAPSLSLEEAREMDCYEFAQHCEIPHIGATLSYDNSTGLTHTGFQYGSTPACRIQRELENFELLTASLRSDVHNDLRNGYAAISTSGTHVACFRNTADKERGRLTLLPLARWLRLFGELSDADVQKIVNTMRVGKIEFVTSYSDIYDAYTKSGIGSCMSHDHRSYEVTDRCDDIYDGRPLHPVWCYAEHEHLRLAIIRRGDDIVGRALVNEQNKRFWRVYGDYALHAALTSAGYTEDSGYLSGISLRSRIIGGQHLLHPYVDGEYSCGEVDVMDDDDVTIHLTYSDGLDLQNTDGGTLYFRDGGRYECPVCGESHNDSYTVIDGDGDHLEDVCWSCYSGTVVARDGDGHEYTNVLPDGIERCELTGRDYIRYYMTHTSELGWVEESAYNEWLDEQEEEEDDE